MGQRSQVYIRYKNKEKMVAMHLQWNYGYYMINRAFQLLDYISKNLKSDYDNFTSEHFDISNRNNSDETILKGLIQCNMTIGSFVGGYDLIKEQYNYYNEDNEKEFKMIPKNQDNNNGILVIDIGEDKKIKYGLAGGYEEVDNMQFDDDFTMINASKYFELSEKSVMEEYKLENKDKELYEKVLKQVEFIDSFELLTQEEYEEIFEQTYLYENCLKEKDLKGN